MLQMIGVLVGLVLLTMGADFIVRGATGIARRFRISELLIGLTLVGFGTSTPELVSSVQAALLNSPGVAVGNVVGSNIANILLILGLSALITPINVDPKAFRRDGAVLAIATALLVIAGFFGELGRLTGAAFIVLIAGYIVFAYLTERRGAPAEAARHEVEARNLPKAPAVLWLDFSLVVAGLAFLVAGARLLVSNAIAIAASFGLSESIIGLTVVAVGTSLPELFTSAAAALRGRSEMALGNVIGSNIYNIFAIIGVTALIRPVAAPADIVAFDNWVMAATTLFLLLFATTQNRIERWEGWAFIAGYAAYLGMLLARAL